MSLKIMVVDDDPQALTLIKSVLEPVGCEVLTMGDSREAARRVEKQKFDGVFLDVRMPFVDGFELTKRIRASRSNSRVPIVMITGLDDIETMRKAFKEGVTFFLGKPFNVDMLRGLINAMRSSMLREKRRYARLPLRTVVSCAHRDKRFKSGSLNLSEGGMLLEPSGGLDLGQELDLQFMFPHVPEAVRPRAKVVRKDPPDRIAVEFIRLSPEDLAAIQGYIAGGVKL